MAQPPRRRIAPGPMNTSAAAGAPAPPSAAATAPPSASALAAAAQTGEPVKPRGFYAPESPPGTAAESSLPESFVAGVQRDAAAFADVPQTADAAIAERAAAEVEGDPEDLSAAIARIRAIRKPLGAFSQKLALSVRPGYHRHWFNDVAGRIEEAADNGWAHVKGTDGQPIKRCVGTGRDKGALYAFAMEIPEVFWQEDQDARNQAATDKIESLKSSPFRAEPGTAKPSDRGKFYDPTETEAGPIQVVKGA